MVPSCSLSLPLTQTPMHHSIMDALHWCQRERETERDGGERERARERHGEKARVGRRDERVRAGEVRWSKKKETAIRHEEEEEEEEKKIKGGWRGGVRSGRWSGNRRERNDGQKMDRNSSPPPLSHPPSGH